MPLPIAYQARLQQVPGVEIATHQTWFGGVYQDPTNFFANIAVEPERFLKVYPEFVLPPEQMKAWLADRQGAIVGRDLAERFDWKIGDRIPLTAPSGSRNGGQTWEFNIVGIYDGGDGVDKTQFFFRYDYLDENRVRRERAGRLVRREGCGPRAVARAEPRASTRCSPIRPPRRRPRRRKDSSRASPSRSATSAPS